MSPTQILSRYYDYISLFLLEDTQALKSKKTELRLYCDLLMQEIHKVKTIGNRENDTSTTSSNGGDELDETMVKATCDTFIQTLDELMELADQQYHIYGNHRDRVSKVETNHEKKKKKWNKIELPGRTSNFKCKIWTPGSKLLQKPNSNSEY